MTHADITAIELNARAARAAYLGALIRKGFARLRMPAPAPRPITTVTSGL